MVLGTQAGGNRWRYSLDIGGSMANHQTTVFEDSNGQWRPSLQHRHLRIAGEAQADKRDLRLGAGEARWTAT
jgi:hypothetical protein